MIRFVAIAVFSLSVRVFAAPSLCSHETVEHKTDKQMNHCHEQSATEKAGKNVPCNHMKDCLLDAGDSDSMVLHSVHFDIDSKIVVSFFGLRSFDEINRVIKIDSFYLPPPGLMTGSPPVYISKSSLLI